MLLLEAETQEDLTKLSIDELFDRLRLDKDYEADPLDEEFEADFTEEKSQSIRFEKHADWLTSMDSVAAEEGNIEKPATQDQLMGFLQRFFANKTRSFGGPINPAKLFAKRNIEMMQRLLLSDCLIAFHQCIETQKNITAIHKFTPRTRTMLYRQLEMEAFSLGIPKSKFGGILLVYLNLCLGYNV